MHSAYDSDGTRISKSTGGVTTIYHVQDGVCYGETRSDGVSLQYLRDETGKVIGYRYQNEDTGSNAPYYFVFNLQGDVVQIVDQFGAVVANYTYDTWGKLLSATNASGNALGTTEAAYYNPFLYRGYYYDYETGFYYLQSRYYDPVVGRFINADDPGLVTASPMSFADKNLFAYCDNNPVSRLDAGGGFWDTFFDIVSLCASVVEVIQHPDDPLAWVGLAADAVSLAVPFATGGGLVVDAVTKVDNVADVVDAGRNVDKTVDALDAAGDAIKAGENTGEIVKKSASNGWHLGEDVSKATKAANKPSWSTVRQRYWKNEAYYHPELYPNDLDRLKKGLAPIGPDGFSMELHHPNGREGDYFFDFEPLTRTEHRIKHYGR